MTWQDKVKGIAFPLLRSTLFIGCGSGSRYAAETIDLGGIVAFDYPTQSGIQQALEARGFSLGWVRLERVASIELKGGEVDVEPDPNGAPATFRTRDGMVLVKRPKLP